MDLQGGQTADSETHSDLRPLRGGGGGNFGVVTSTTFRLHQVGNYERLRAIKSAYDPANVFQSNHNFPPLPD